MSKKEPKLILKLILRDIELIQEYLEGWSKREFLNSVEKKDSVSKRLENIGELVKKLPTSLRKKYKEIPWRQVTGLRDNMAHEYDDIDFNSIWETVKYKLPKFESQIRKIKQELEES